MNFKEEFQKNVIDYFVKEYLEGRTPNPCIACNRYVKWESLLKRSMDIGADYIATGHYSRVAKLDNMRYAIRKSVTDAKDQTYALYNLTQEQLAHTLMPVGEYEKPQIRAIAEKIGLNVANKPDSQEICFVPDNNYAGFIQRETGRTEVPGNFVDTSGNIIGTHKGISHYTVGQRKGLGISFGYPVFVKKIDAAKNEVIIGSNADVFSDTLTAECMNYMGVSEFKPGDHVQAKIRYGHKGACCVVTDCNNDKLRLKFDEPVRAITPGQAVVLYDDDVVLGGGIIIGE